MGVIMNSEIRGFLFSDGEVACLECAEPMEDELAIEEEILSVSDVDGGEKRYFCDNCRKKLCGKEPGLTRS